ncbi:uncharacterized protein RBU33_012737 isoform 2-T2 [Hipposideros larvatus]
MNGTWKRTGWNLSLTSPGSPFCRQQPLGGTTSGWWRRSQDILDVDLEVVSGWDFALSSWVSWKQRTPRWMSHMMEGAQPTPDVHDQCGWYKTLLCKPRLHLRVWWRMPCGEVGGRGDCFLQSSRHKTSVLWFPFTISEQPAKSGTVE